MKSSYLRAGAVLACALALSACGGSDGDLPIGGQFIGVTKPGLVLQNNGGADLAVPPTNSGRGQFFFPELVETDARYNVTIKSFPTNASNCEVTDGSGRAQQYLPTRVLVACVIRKHELKGTVSGLTGTLVLINGADKVTLAPGATSFAMAKVDEDAPYGVAILTQPDNQTCAVANGTGTMGPNDVTNVAVTCGPRT